MTDERALSYIADAIRNLDSRLRDTANRESRPRGIWRPVLAADGATNDHPKIQAAIDAANAAGGGIVQLPVGHISLHERLIQRTWVTIQGVGIGTSLRPIAGVDGIYITPSSTDWQLKQLQVLGGRNGVVQEGEASDCDLLHVHIGGQSGNGLVTDAFERATLYRVGLQSIAGHGWLGCQPAGIPGANTRVQRVAVIEMYANQIGLHGISWPDAPTSRNPSGFGSVFTQCNFVQIGRHGLHFEHLLGLVIDGFSVENCSIEVDNTYDAIHIEANAFTTIQQVRIQADIDNTGAHPNGHRYGVYLIGYFSGVEYSGAEGRTAGFLLFPGNPHEANGVVSTNNNGTFDATQSGIRTLYGNAAYNPPSVAAGADVSPLPTVTVAGAAIGDHVKAGFTQSLQGMSLTGYVSAVDTVTCVLHNGTAGAIDLATGTLRVAVDHY